MMLKAVPDDVTFAQLRTFACAARAGSFAKAADQLDISQPAVSEQVKILEQRLGRALFERRRGTTSLLTPEGADALEIIEAMLALSADLFARKGAAQDKIVVRVSAGPFLQENYLRALVPRLHRELPEVEIEFHPTTFPHDVHRQIERGEVDLAIFSIPGEEAVPPNTRQICELPLAVIAPIGTRESLASGRRRLGDYDVLFPGRRETDLRWARRFLRDLGIDPSAPILFIEFVETLVQMVEDGEGISRLVADLVGERAMHGRVEMLDIPLVPMRRLIGRSPHAPPIAKTIEQMLCEALTP